MREMTDVGSCRYTLVETSSKVVSELKSRGCFDTFRRECLADVDTRPAYQNLRQRVEGSVSAFLDKQSWPPNANRNQLRDKLRRSLADSRFLEVGVDRIVDQVVDRNIYTTYLPTINGLVQELLDIEPQPNEERLDDDMDIADAGDTDVVDLVNPFGTWANQFHVPVPCESNVDSSMSISSDSDHVSRQAADFPQGLSTKEALHFVPIGDDDDDGLRTPDVHAQMSPLSDECGRRWSSFIDPGSLSPSSLSPRSSSKFGLDSDLSRMTNRLDPVIDRMIKTELDATEDMRASTASCRQLPRQQAQRRSRRLPDTPPPPAPHVKVVRRCRGSQQFPISQVGDVHSHPNEYTTSHYSEGSMSPPFHSRRTFRGHFRSGDDARQTSTVRRASTSNAVADSRRRSFHRCNSHTREKSRCLRSENRDSISHSQPSRECDEKLDSLFSSGGRYSPCSRNSRSRFRTRSGLTGNISLTPPRPNPRISPLRSSPKQSSVLCQSSPKMLSQHRLSETPPKCLINSDQLCSPTARNLGEIGLSLPRSSPSVFPDRHSETCPEASENFGEGTANHVERLVSPRTPPFPGNGKFLEGDSVRVGPRTPPLSSSIGNKDGHSPSLKDVVPLSIPLPDQPISYSALTLTPLPSEHLPLQIPLPHSPPPEQSHPSHIPLPLAPAPLTISDREREETRSSECAPSVQTATASSHQVLPINRSREHLRSRSPSILSSISHSSSFSSESRRRSSHSSLTPPAKNTRSWSSESSRSTVSRPGISRRYWHGREPPRYHSHSSSPQTVFSGDRRSPLCTERARSWRRSPFSPVESRFCRSPSVGSPCFGPDGHHDRVRQDCHGRRPPSTDSSSSDILDGPHRWTSSALSGRRDEWRDRSTGQWSADEQLPAVQWLDRYPMSPHDWRARRHRAWPLSPQRASLSPLSPERRSVHNTSVDGDVWPPGGSSSYFRPRYLTPAGGRSRRWRRRWLRGSGDRDDGEDPEHNDYRHRLQQQRRSRRDDYDDEDPRPSTTPFRSAARNVGSSRRSAVIGGGGDGSGGGSRRSSVRSGYRALLSPVLFCRFCFYAHLFPTAIAQLVILSGFHLLLFSLKTSCGSFPSVSNLELSSLMTVSF